MAARLSARGRERLGVALLAVAGCLLALGAVEAGLRLAGVGEDRGPHVLRRVSADGRLGLDLYSENPWDELDVDLRLAEVRRHYAAQGLADLDEAAGSTPFGVECRYRDRAFRGAPLPAKQPALTRVLVLGDSFTEGQGVREDAVYPQALARALERAAAGRFEVGNRGHRGWDFPRLYEAFQELLAEQPDIVVYGMVLNDVERTAEFQGRQSYLNDWIVDRSARTGAPTGFLARHLRLAGFVHQRLQSWHVSRATTRWYRDMYGAENARGWRRTQRQLRQMSVDLRRRGGVLIVALWPLLVEIDEGYPFAEASEAVARSCREAGIPFTDLRVALRGRPTASLWVTTADHHPNALAHQLAAEALVSAVLAASQSIQPPPRHSSSS